MVISTVALIFSQLHNRHFSVHAPPVMNQISLCGLLPFPALMMPNYPLLHVNILLFVTMSALNTIFMAKKKMQHVIILVILLVFAPLVHVYHEQNDNSVQSEDAKRRIHIYSELDLYEAPNILIPANLSPAYLVHFFVMMIVNFLCLVLAS